MTAAPALADCQMPFPGAAGRGLKIAVIDSGVNLRHPHICAPTYGADWPGAVDDASWEDTLGHGTAVTAAIQEKAPAAEYYVLRLFGKSLRATTPRLLEAIEWSIDKQMDIVNLSLGTQNPESRSAFQRLLHRASASGMIVVSARNSGPNPVFPGALEGLIGVVLDWELPRFRYRITGGADASFFAASGYPRPLPGMSPGRNLNGISFAVANMTGFVARACEGLRRRSIESVCEALASEACRLSAGPSF